MTTKPQARARARARVVKLRAHQAAVSSGASDPKDIKTIEKTTASDIKTIEKTTASDIKTIEKTRAKVTSKQ